MESRRWILLVLAAILVAGWVMLVTRREPRPDPAVPGSFQDDRAGGTPKSLRCERPDPGQDARRTSLPSKGVLRLEIRDIVDDAPLEGARLLSGALQEGGWVYGLVEQGASDAAGTLELEWSSDTGPALIAKDGYMRHPLTEENLRLDALNKVYLRRSNRVTFTFRDRFGAWIEGYKVVISRAQLHRTGHDLLRTRVGSFDLENRTFLGISDAAGVATLSGVQPGLHRVVVFHESFLPSGGWCGNYIDIKGDEAVEIECSEAFVSCIRFLGDPVIHCGFSWPPGLANSMGIQSQFVLEHSIKERFPGSLICITTGDRDRSSRDFFAKKTVTFRAEFASAGSKSFPRGFVPLSEFSGPHVEEVLPTSPPRTRRFRLFLRSVGQGPFPPGSKVPLYTSPPPKGPRALGGRVLGGHSLQFTTGEFLVGFPGLYHPHPDDPVLRSALEGTTLDLRGAQDGDYFLDLNRRIVPVDLVIESPSGLLPDYGTFKYSELSNRSNHYSLSVTESTFRVHVNPVQCRLELECFGFQGWAMDLDGAILSHQKPNLIPVRLEYRDQR